MAVKYGPAKPARFELNMAALTQVQQALAHGLQNFGEAIAHEAARTVEYATDPHHIRDQWGVATWFFGKKVGNASADGSAVAKPREFRTGKETASGIVGFGFPARFHEVGTSDTPAEPFLSPAVARISGNVQELIREGAAPHWPRSG